MNLGSSSPPFSAPTVPSSSFSSSSSLNNHGSGSHSTQQAFSAKIVINPFAKPPIHPAPHTSKESITAPPSTSKRSAFDRYKSARPSISQLKREEPSDDEKNSNEEEEDVEEDDEEEEEEEDVSDDEGENGLKTKTKFEVDSDGEGDREEYDRGNSESKGKAKEWRQNVKVS